MLLTDLWKARTVQLKQRVYAVVFVMVIVLIGVAFTLSSSAPRIRASEMGSLASIEESVKSLAGAFSMLAGDVRVMKNEAMDSRAREAANGILAREEIDGIRSRAESDAHAETISRQNLTEAVDRLSVRVERLERNPCK